MRNNYKTSIQKHICFILLALPIIATKSALAQSLVVRGTVKDESGTSMPGVNIAIKGNAGGTVTDSKGKFQLNTNKNNVLVFSFVGYNTVQDTIRGSAPLIISMSPALRALNDVVVVGYGTQQKSNVSGAITTVSSKDVALSPEANVGAGLAGRMPGVVINNRGGEPGNQAVSVFIRGFSTTGDANPLYVIDGIVRDYNGLGYLNPNEIESITILKDASAAIYGSRAANGVILVTTKRGKDSKPVVTATFNTALMQPERVPQAADSYLFATMSNLEQRLKGLPEPYSAKDLQLYQDGSDPLGHPDTHYKDTLFRPWSQQKRADLSVAGGSKEVHYFVSAGYLDQNSPYRYGFVYNRQASFRSNIDANISKDLKVSLDVAGRNVRNNQSNASIGLFYLGLPTLNIIYPNGLTGPGNGGYSTVSMVRDPNYGYTNTQDKNFIGTLSADYKIPGVDGLSLQGNFAYDDDHAYRKTWIGVSYYYQLDPFTGQYNKVRGSNAASPSLAISSPETSSTTANIKLNYKHTFGKLHTIDAFLGYEQNQSQSIIFTAGRTNFASQAIAELFAGDSNKNNQSNNGSSASTAYKNYLGRALYSFSDRYNLQFQFRYDGSQNFAPGKRYGFFPGVSGNWNIANEKFMKGISWLDNLKLRASWGEMGNDKISPYQYLTSYTYGSNYAFNGITNQGLVQTNAPNPDITWEVAKTTDIGLEFNIFKGTLQGSVDYFNTTRSNILALRNASVPSYTGLTLPDQNFGKVRNRGIEATLTHNYHIGALKYSIEGNFTFARNKVLFIDEVPGLPDYQQQTGHPLGAATLYETDGIFKSQAQIDATPHIAGVVPGDLIYKDINGDGNINNRDMVRQKYSVIPEIVYGINPHFAYKQFDLSLGFQGQANAQGEKYNVLPFDPVGWGNFPPAQAQNVWSPENPNGTNPIPGQQYATGTSYTTWRYASAAFLKLKTAEFGYTFKPQLLEKAGIRSARIYVSGSNLIYLRDNFRDVGLDPETPMWGWNLDQQRVINLGITVTL